MKGFTSALILSVCFLVISACSKDGNKPVPENRTFAFEVGNVKFKDGVAPTAAAVVVEKAKLETIVKLSKGTK